MIIYILLTAISTALHSNSPFEINSANRNPNRSSSSLEDIQAQIDKLAKKDHMLKLKFNRLAELVFENQQAEISINQVDMVPSIGIPYKDNFYYTMMFKKGEHFYSLKGDLIYSNKNKTAAVVSARNQYTYFVQIKHSQLLYFYRCKLVNKKTVIQLQHIIEIGNQTSIHVDWVFISQYSNNKQFILVDKAGKINIADRNNNTLQQIATKQSIVQIQKLNHNLVVLTEQQLFFLNINKNYTRIGCMLPQGSIDYFKYQDSNFRFIYGIKDGVVYQFELSHQCKITKIMYIPYNSTIHIASQLAFIFARSKHYTLNLTSGLLKPYRLPVTECRGQQKISIIRKIQSQYVLSRICLYQNKTHINMLSIDLHEEEPNTADFSKFRIPLLLLSFGVIVYMAVRNKKTQKSQEQSEQQVRMRLFQHYPQLRQAALKQQTARMGSTLIQNPVSNKQNKTAKKSSGSKQKTS